MLAMLARRAAADAGAVGKTVKGVLADFKKTRQDTWGTDQKVCFLLSYSSYGFWQGLTNGVF